MGFSIYTLGTGAAASDPHRTTVMLAASTGNSSILVDCGGDALHRYMQAGLDLATLDALIITHEHADHVSGFPLLIEKLWLFDRDRPLPIFGIPEALDQAQRTFDTFDTSGWDDMPELQWNEVEYSVGAEVISNDTWYVTAAPNEHSKPCVGLRFETSQSDKAAAYSCDTGPSENIVELSRNADLLVHEANGDFEGHSTAREAADIAAKADAGRLVLVHLPPGLTNRDLIDARKVFEDVELAEEGGRYLV